MAGISGPSIINSGLVLALDAANRNSYVSGSKNIFDLSGTSVTGSLKNGVGYSATNGGNLVFDGTNDYVTCGTGITQTFTNFSAEAIVKVGVTNKKQAIFSTYDVTNGGYGLEILDNTFSNKFNWFGFTNASTYKDIQSTVGVTLNSIYNVTVVFQASTTMSIYINGIFDNSVATTLPSITKGAAAPFQLGDDPAVGSLYFQGNIYSLKVYNRVLSASEVLQNYNATKARFGL